MPRFLAALAVLCVCVPAVALAAADTDPKKTLTRAFAKLSATRLAAAKL